MARLPWILRYPETASGTATKTLLQLVTTAHQRIVLNEVSVSWKGISNTAAPVLVELLYQTTAGTMTAANPAAEDVGAGETLQTTGQRDATAEPTAGTIIRSWEVHQQSGFIWQATGPRDEILISPGGTARRIGLRLVSPGASVSITAYLRGEE